MTQASTTSTRGPRVLTFVGAGMLLLTIAITVGAVALFASLLPLDILSDDGLPGAGAVGSTEAPGSAEVTLERDTDYAIYLATVTKLDHSGLDGAILVTAPDGTSWEANAGPGVNANAERGGVTARTVAAFHTDQAGEYRITAPAMLDASEATIIIAHDRAVLPFVGGILGTIAGAFVAFGGTIVGLGLTIGGAVWWHLRTGNRRAQQSSSV